jgi:hypothetical protein
MSPNVSLLTPLFFRSIISPRWRFAALLSIAGIVLALEIQRGKLPMRQLQYCQELGATTACTLRLCQAAAYSGVKFSSRRQAFDNRAREAFLGDSWFTGVRVAKWAADVGHSYFGALKTSIKCSPYEELITKMSDYSSGTYLVMACTSPKGHDLICIGYKYSASKVLVFLGTKNAGSTTPGEPYIAKFPDANGNVAQRSVPRPAVISNYFNDSNVIDTHNQACQFKLALEKRWVTQDCFFRVTTTLIGMTVTDCWRAYKHALKPITIKEFADCLAHDCIYNPHSDVAALNTYLAISTDAIDTPRPAVETGGRQSDVSSVTEATTTVNVFIEHPFNKNPEREQGGKGRPIRRHCKFPGCSKTTALMCFNRRCLQYSYECSHGTVFGVFYCTEHQYNHYERVLEGTGSA